MKNPTSTIAQLSAGGQPADFPPAPLSKDTTLVDSRASVQSTRQSIARRRLQAGVSNLQIMIGVLIGAIMVMGGITLIKQLDKAKVDNEVRELARYKKKTASLLAQRGTSVGINLQTTIALDFFQPDVISGVPGSRTVRNQWGGTINVLEATVTTSGDALAFRYTGVSSSACKQLGMQIGSIASAVTVQGITVKSTATAIAALAGPTNVNQAALIAQCDGGADNVIIDFYLTK